MGKRTCDVSTSGEIKGSKRKCIEDQTGANCYDQRHQAHVPRGIQEQVTGKQVCILRDAPTNCWNCPDDTQVCVCVFGLFKSGTKAVSEYLREHFKCDVTPARGKHPHVGKVLVNGMPLWKHHVPVTPMVFGSNMKMSQLCTRLTLTGILTDISACHAFQLLLSSMTI